LVHQHVGSRECKHCNNKHEHLIHGGSRPRRSLNLPRDWQFGHDRIYDDYFFGNPMYDGKLLKRRYKMNKTLFLKIMDTLVAYDVYFSCRGNVVGV
jgi:hypothetical protein